MSKIYEIVKISTGSKSVKLLGLVLLLMFRIDGSAQDLRLRYTSHVFLSELELYNALALQIFTLDENCIRVASEIGGIDTVWALQENSLNRIDLGPLFDPYLSSFDLADTTNFYSYTIYTKNPIAILRSISDSTSLMLLGLPAVLENLRPDYEASDSYYTINQQFQRSGEFNTAVQVLSLYDSTVIQIKSPNTYANSNAPSAVTTISAGNGAVTLSKGESIRAINGSLSGFNDINMNGIYLKANKPFKVLIDDTGGHAGYSNEAQPCLPIAFADNRFGVIHKPEQPRLKFYAVPVNGQGIDYVHMVAEQPNTEVYWNGSLVKNLDEGEYWDSCFFQAGLIEANKEIFLGQFVQATHPFPSNGEVYATATFGLNDGDFFERFRFKMDTNLFIDFNPYLILLSPLKDTGTVAITGPVTVLEPWQPIANSQMAWSKYLIDTVEYSINAPSKVAAYYYSCSYTNVSRPFIQVANSTKLRGLNNEPDMNAAQAFSIKIADKIQALKSDTVAICEGENITLFSPDQGVSKWRLQLGNDAAVFSRNDFGQDTFSFSFPQSGLYPLNIEDIRGCEPSKRLWIRVDQSPSLSWDYQILKNCEGEFLALNGQSNSAEPIEWFINNKSYFGDSILLPIRSTESEFDLRITTKWKSCEDIRDVKVLRDEDQNPFTLPNVITPNGDGFNDQWCFADFGSSFEHCFQVTISNRWGQVLYSSSSVNDCWSPENLDPGVYYYVIHLGGRDLIKGFMHLQK